MADFHGPGGSMFRSYWNLVINYHRGRNFGLVRRMCLRLVRSDEFPRWYRIAASLLLAYHDYHPRARVEVAFKAIEEIETEMRQSGKKPGPITIGLRTWAESVMRCVEEKEAKDGKNGGEGLDSEDWRDSDGYDTDEEPAFGPDTRPTRQMRLQWYGVPWWDLIVPLQTSPFSPFARDHQLWALPDAFTPYQSPYEPLGPASAQNTG